jgi:UDP-N-acetylmuramoylalanine--D-glutamate ligase
MTGRFAGKRAVVIGAGVAGSSAALALLHEGAEVVVTERGEVEDPSELEAAGAAVRSGGHLVEHLEGADLVVTSPGVPPSAEVLTWARGMGIPVWGELELGARLASVPYLAVTGTNGKTTATGMLAAFLRAAGRDAVACGNIGLAFPTAALAGHDVLVVEASSFQLATQTSFHPVVSVLLNVAADHLDWHGSFDDYVDAKAKVHALQAGDDVHVGNRDDPIGARVSASAVCRTVWFRLGEPEGEEVGYVGDALVSRLGADVEIAEVDADRTGYRADAAAAAAAAIAYGVSGDAVAAGLAAYIPARHRGETVASVDGVRFVDNSKATNVHAAITAIDGVHGAVLIAGGRAKGQDLSALADRADRLSAVVAIGESADAVVRVFEGRVPTKAASSIEEATQIAYELALPSGVVLLAPACASWDQFRDYVERGERFTAAARALGTRAG